MSDIGDTLRKIELLHPEFSLKIGRKGGQIVVELAIGRHRPATIMGGDLGAAVGQAHAAAVQNVADDLLAESRLSEAVFDSAVEDTEKGHCCSCCGCCPDNDEDEYDEYDEDDNY